MPVEVADTQINVLEVAGQTVVSEQQLVQTVQIGMVGAQGPAGASDLAAINAHEADTTAIHGIADTAQLARKDAANTFLAAQTISGGTTALDRLNLGADVNLYRSAADTLKTDDALTVLKRLSLPTTGSANGITLSDDGYVYTALESGSRNLHLGGGDRIYPHAYSIPMQYIGIGFEGTAGQTFNQNGYTGGFDFFSIYGGKFRFGDTALAVASTFSFKPRGTGNNAGEDLTAAWFQSLFGTNAPTLVVKAGTAQTANLQEWRDTSNNVLAKVASSGALTSVSSLTIGSGLAGATATFTVGTAPTRLILDTPLQTTAFRSNGNGVATFGIAGGQEYVSHIYTSGTLWFGTGGVAQDTNLFRGAADILRTNDNLSVDGYVSVGTYGAGETTITTANSGGILRLKKTTAAPGNPGAANYARVALRDGTNADTLRLVVQAGTAGAETTILDNIPQS